MSTMRPVGQERREVVQEAKEWLRDWKVPFGKNATVGLSKRHAVLLVEKLVAALDSVGEQDAASSGREPHCHTCCCFGPPQTAVAPSPPSAAAPEPVPTSVIRKALADYRCTYQYDEDGGGLALVDVVTPEDEATIKLGNAELDDLADFIGDAIDSAPAVGESRAAPQKPVAWGLMRQGVFVTVYQNGSQPAAPFPHDTLVPLYPAPAVGSSRAAAASPPVLGEATKPETGGAEDEVQRLQNAGAL